MQRQLVSHQSNRSIQGQTRQSQYPEHRLTGGQLHLDQTVDRALINKTSQATRVHVTSKVNYGQNLNVPIQKQPQVYCTSSSSGRNPQQNQVKQSQVDYRQKSRMPEFHNVRDTNKALNAYQHKSDNDFDDQTKNLLGTILQDLSHQYAQRLMGSAHLSKLSFANGSQELKCRKEISSSIVRLGGKWNLSMTSQTNYIVMQDEFFTMDNFMLIRKYRRKNQIGDETSLLSNKILNDLQRVLDTAENAQFAETYHNEQKHILNDSTGISDDKNNQNVRSVPIVQKPSKKEKFKQYLWKQDQMPVTNRIISLNDLQTVLKFQESKRGKFHTDQMKFLWLQVDQRKPTHFKDDGTHLVISKLTQNTLGGRDPLQDQFARQVFHQFDELILRDDSEGRSKGKLSGKRSASHRGTDLINSLKMSPGKNRFQLNSANNQNFGALRTPHKENQKVLERYELHIDAPQGWCPCLTQSEHRFAFDNYDRIQDQRKLQTERELRANKEADLDMEPYNNNTIEEPIPNVAHTYCQVCNDNYEDYLEHINSETHKLRTKTQNSYYKEIDQIFTDLTSAQGWKTNWKTDPEPIDRIYLPPIDLPVEHSSVQSVIKSQLNELSPKNNMPLLASPHFDEEMKESEQVQQVEQIAEESEQSYDEEDGSFEDSDVVVDLYQTEMRNPIEDCPRNSSEESESSAQAKFSREIEENKKQEVAEQVKEDVVIELSSESGSENQIKPTDEISQDHQMSEKENDKYSKFRVSEEKQKDESVSETEQQEFKCPSPYRTSSQRSPSPIQVSSHRSPSPITEKIRTPQPLQISPDKFSRNVPIASLQRSVSPAHVSPILYSQGRSPNLDYKSPISIKISSQMSNNSKSPKLQNHPSAVPRDSPSKRRLQMIPEKVENKIIEMPVQKFNVRRDQNQNYDRQNKDIQRPQRPMQSERNFKSVECRVIPELQIAGKQSAQLNEIKKITHVVPVQPATHIYSQASSMQRSTVANTNTSLNVRPGTTTNSLNASLDANVKPLSARKEKPVQQNVVKPQAKQKKYYRAGVSSNFNMKMFSMGNKKPVQNMQKKRSFTDAFPQAPNAQMNLQRQRYR